MANRPLSPHLTVYRFAYTMALSILHRITGTALSVGLIALVVWLGSLAAGEKAYTNFLSVAASWPFKVLVGLWVVAFVYHLCNGIRHLFWDAGLGLERVQARRSGRIVVIAVVVLSTVLLLVLFGRAAA
jgi:succinate dehydrogenase / fumarate reductase cytochrome b subunit